MTRQAFAVIWCCFLLVAYVRAAEWDCASASNTGAFTRSTDCTISGSNQVDVTNTLEINGTNTDMNNLITITAATNKRHFKVGDNGVLRLEYIQVTGIQENTGGIGYIAGSSSGILQIKYCILTLNHGSEGGAIAIRGKDSSLYVYHSIITKNTAAYAAGCDIYKGTAVIFNSTISENIATYSGGGIIVYSVHPGETSQINISASNIVNNTAADEGGGLLIQNSANVYIRDSVIRDNYANNGKGNEILIERDYGYIFITIINTQMNQVSLVIL